MVPSALNEIAEWKLDAKSEDTRRYFFNIQDVDKLISGGRSFVIGRKGSGKTAICEYIALLDGNDQNHEKFFCEKLSFKNFPFNELYLHNNQMYARPNQYISIWKFVIYSTFCKMIARSNTIDQEIKSSLGRLYLSDSTAPLQRLLPKWTSTSFQLSVLGVGGGYSREREQGEPLSWAQKVDLLEDFINSISPSEKYFVLFDALDEDYKDFLNYERSSEYVDLITSLFKAIQDVKSSLKLQNSFHPIVFLRDDIYELVQDADKTKWSDFKIDLDWRKESIKRLMAFRISRAIEPSGPVLTFDEAWAKIVSAEEVRVGKNDTKSMHPFEFILSNTHMRPRDFVKYLKIASERAIQSERHTIAASDITAVNREFSNYLKSELMDEIYAVVPHIRGIFDAVSQSRKQLFSHADLIQIVNSCGKMKGGSEKFDTDLIIQFLFHFGIIGNFSIKSQKRFFRVFHKESRINYREKFVIHRGLLKALQIGAA